MYVLEAPRAVQGCAHFSAALALSVMTNVLLHLIIGNLCVLDLLVHAMHSVL